MAGPNKPVSSISNYLKISTSIVINSQLGFSGERNVIYFIFKQ